MYSSKVLSSDHRDLIHDVAFNWYGTHLATCSSDQNVKVWTLDEVTKVWNCTASWKSHSGAVWKVTWAHPEFGQVLATCSFDRTASVWEEVPGSQKNTAGGGGGGFATKRSSAGIVAESLSSLTTSSSSSTATANVQQQQQQQGQQQQQQTHWVKKTSLVDSRTSVTDIKFAPRHLGLLLATCSADGTVRIYEAPDVMNLSQWALQHEIPCRVPCSCLSWNSTLSRSVPPMIAVGSDDRSPTSGGKVFIFEYSEAARRWLRVETLSTITDPVHDIAFAPNVGRSYSVLAVASKDLRIVTLKPVSAMSMSTMSSSASVVPDGLVGDSSSMTSSSGTLGGSVTKYEVRLAGQFNDHSSIVWRVCWNVTGTILASSGDDGHVRLWKANYLDNWKCVATLSGDGSNVSGGLGAMYNSSSSNVNNSNSSIAAAAAANNNGGPNGALGASASTSSFAMSAQEEQQQQRQYPGTAFATAPVPAAAVVGSYNGRGNSNLLGNQQGQGEGGRSFFP